MTRRFQRGAGGRKLKQAPLREAKSKKVIGCLKTLLIINAVFCLVSKPPRLFRGL